MSATDLGVDVSSTTEVLEVIDPPERKGGEKVESPEQLVEKLKEAGVI